MILTIERVGRGLGSVIDDRSGISGDGRSGSDRQVDVQADVVGVESRTRVGLLDLELEVRIVSDKEAALRRCGAIKKAVAGVLHDTDHDAAHHIARGGLSHIGER
jgi:hypothetical protein